jgi:hypothetical protein
MRRTLLRFGFLMASAAPLACGPATPIVESPTKPVATTDTSAAPAGVAVAAKTTFDLSPVPEPADLVGIVRWKNPAATLGVAASAAGLPPAILDAGSREALNEILKEALHGMVNARQLAAVVALDAPVDIAAVLDPAPRKRDILVAISVGLTSLDQAKEAAAAVGTVTEVVPGMWRLGGKDRFGTSCAIAASAGTTPARLVCADREREMMTLAPYLARTMPTMSVPQQADIHGEFRFVPVEARYGGQLRELLSKAPALAESQLTRQDPKFDRAIIDAAASLADEAGAIATDLDKVTIDITLAPNAGLTAAGSLQLRARKSWLAQTITERPERAGPPPAFFWRAPKDATSASFGRGSDPSRFTPIFKTLRTLIEAGLATEKVGSPADRKALADLVALPLGKDTNTVTASGQVPPPAKPGGTPQQRFDALAAAWVGWHLFGADESPAALTKWIKDAVAVYNRPALLAPIRKAMRNDASFIPSIKVVPAPAQLGAGSLEVDITVANLPAEDVLPDATPQEKKAKVTLRAHILLMADGKQTWMAVGTSKDELVKRLLSVKTGAPDAGTLATRPGLEALRSGSNMSAGFMTLASFTSGLPGMLEPMAAEDSDVKAMLEAVKNLPNKGEVPILMGTRVTVGAASRSEVALNMPKKAIEDIVAFTVNMLKQQSKKPPAVAAP